MNTENHYRVSKLKWREWSMMGRHVFNEVYDQMVSSPWVFQSPAVAKAPPGKRSWKTTAWNTAWIAADAASESGRMTHTIDVDSKGHPLPKAEPVQLATKRVEFAR